MSQCGQEHLSVTGAPKLQASSHTCHRQYDSNRSPPIAEWLLCTCLPPRVTKTPPETETEISPHFASEKTEAPSGKQQAKESGEQKLEAWPACRVSGLTHHLPTPHLGLRLAIGLAGLAGGGGVPELEPRDLLPAKEGVCSEAGVDKQQRLRSGSCPVPTHVQRIVEAARHWPQHWLWGLARPGFKSQFPNHVAYGFHL